MPNGTFLHDRMSEAEVSIRLAEHLSTLSGFNGQLEVAIDGASVSVGGVEIFGIQRFLREQGWKVLEGTSTGRNDWSAVYVRDGVNMRIHSRSGVGDVEAKIFERRVVAECKKGPLIKKAGSPEYSLLTMAVGQALLFRAHPDDLLVAAVPDTPAFQRIASDWRDRPRLQAAGIQIALVNRTGTVTGLNL